MRQAHQAENAEAVRRRVVARMAGLGEEEARGKIVEEVLRGTPLSYYTHNPSHKPRSLGGLVKI